MKVSVIIPTYNAEAYLTTLLASLQKQTIPFELIIIDSSSTDKTLEVAKEYTNHIVRIPKNEFDHGGTRTKAAKLASGELLIFLTQDALPYDNHTLEKITQSFHNPQVAAAYGRQIPYEHTNLFGKHLRAFNYPSTSHIRTLENKTEYGIKTAFLSDSFAAYRKSTMQEVDWFKNGLILGEDSHITTKLLLADYAIAYVADAKVYHSHSYSLIEEFRRYFDIGVFHTNEHWIFETFGKAEGEGGKYVKSELTYLFKHKAYLHIPEFFIRNGLKYLGYKLGRNYKVFPKSIVPKLSMHPLWWEK
jgi:rhamnosyltransferase